MSEKEKVILSGRPICPICNHGYLRHGFRLYTLECENCGEVFDTKIKYEEQQTIFEL